MSRLGRRARASALGACVVVVMLIAGCGAQPPEVASSPTPTPETTQETSNEGRGDPIDETSGPTTEVVSMTDPVQDAFTVNVPAGWDSLAYTDGSSGVWRYIVNSVSPDGTTVLYSGDPKMPHYWNPDQAHETIRAYAEFLEHQKIEYYEPASFYFPAYVERRFGALPGFDLHTVEYDAEGVEMLQQLFAQSPLQPLDIDAAKVYFDYTADGAPMHGAVVGYTIDSGAFWQADVYGLSTAGSVEDYLPMATSIAHSVQIKPEWTAKQQQNHEQQMAQIEAFGQQMTRQHNANMAAIQASADRHQQRMQAIWSANDASIQSFNERMASGDVQQRNFLNYINDEETVSGTGGQTWQVQTGFQRYWMNPTTNQYVGGDINFDDDDLRRMGLNPNDYQEVKMQG